MMMRRTDQRQRPNGRAQRPRVREAVCAGPYLLDTVVAYAKGAPLEP